MNDEIKEILEIFKQVDLEPEAGGCYHCPIKDEDKTCVGCLNNAKDKLLDYITNLQQENEELKKNQRYHKKGVFCLENDKETMSDMIDDYKSRIEKAVEFMKNFIFEPLLVQEDRKLIMCNENLRKFENILNGRSDE